MKQITHPNDPKDVSVQVQFRCPFWYRKQLVDMAKERGMTLAQFVGAVIEEAVPPIRR